MKIGINGNGLLEKLQNQIKCKDIQLLAYDVNPSNCSPLELN